MTANADHLSRFFVHHEQHADHLKQQNLELKSSRCPWFWRYDSYIYGASC